MATHDMEYTSLPGEIGGARNVHFAEEVTERGIEFGYRVREGASKSRNALRVLESCGIPSEIIERARTRTG
jgi:DNA mismatch repair ATPase MutS